MFKIVINTDMFDTSLYSNNNHYKLIAVFILKINKIRSKYQSYLLRIEIGYIYI